MLVAPGAPPAGRGSSSSLQRIAPPRLGAPPGRSALPPRTPGPDHPVFHRWWRNARWPTCRPSSRGSASRTRSCSPRRHRRSRRRTSCGPTRPAGAAWSRRRSGSIRSSTCRGPKTRFLRVDNGGSRLSMAKRPDTTLMASWNWELIADKPMDWWLPRIRSIKAAWPDRVLVASIMAGSGNDKELGNWQTLVEGVQDAGRRRDRAELLVPAHGPGRHGLERRQGPGAVLGLDAGGQGGRTRPGVGQADAGHSRHRRGGGGHVPRRRRRDLLVEHVPRDAARRPRHPRVRGQRRRLRRRRAAWAGRRSCPCRWPRWRR